MIINPMWFYWVNVFGKIQIACFIIGVVTGFIGCAALACYFDDGGKRTLRDAKRLLLLALCSLSIGIFTPSEKTMTKMLVASQVNETNVEKAKEVVDYICDKIKEVKNDD
jgi:hypothetical protein